MLHWNFLKRLLLVAMVVTSGRCKVIKTEEFKLRQNWPADYDVDARPIRDHSQPVRVKFGVAIGQITEVNTKAETFAVNLFLRQFWKDEYLSWNVTQYGGLNSTNISPEKIWLPDIVLQNNADNESELRGNLDKLTKKVIISSDGQVKWLSIAVLQSVCPMDVTYFPFDEQKCSLKFASWTHDGLKLDIVPENETVDLKPYTPHSEWEMVSTVQRRTVEYYPCCDTPFPVLNIDITIRRRPLFQVIHLIVPMVLVGLLTLFSFNIPARSGERISYGVTLLLAMTLFMLLLSEMIPAAADALSKLGIFFNVLIIEMVVMIFAMCYVARMYHKTSGDKPITRWMRKYVFEYFSYKLRIRDRGVEKRKEFYPTVIVVGGDGELSPKTKEYIEKQSADQNVTEKKIPNGNSRNSLVNKENPLLKKVLASKESNSILSETIDKHDANENGHENTQEDQGPKEERSTTQDGSVVGQEDEAIPLKNSEIVQEVRSNSSGKDGDEPILQIENKDCAVRKNSSNQPELLGQTKTSGFKSIGLSVINKKQQAETTETENTDEKPAAEKQPSVPKSNKWMSFRTVGCTVTNLMKRKNELMIKKLNAERREKRFFYEWRICAQTMDRLCFILFAVIFVLTTIGIFYDF